MHQHQFLTESPEKDPHHASGRSITDMLSDGPETETLEQTEDLEGKSSGMENKGDDAEQEVDNANPGGYEESEIGNQISESTKKDGTEKDEPQPAKGKKGDMAILINGMWWKGDNEGGTTDHWVSKGWVKDWTRRLGANKVRLYDGAGIGGRGSWLWLKRTGAMFANWLPAIRRRRGYLRGKRDAPEIFRQLGPGGKIKILTNSFGDAFERGFAKALVHYAKKYNRRVDVCNTILKLQGKTQRIPKVTESIEYVISLSSYQGRAIGKDKNAKFHYVMRAAKSGPIKALNFPSTHHSAGVRGAKELSDRTVPNYSKAEWRKLSRKQRRAIRRKQRAEARNPDLHPMSGHDLSSLKTAFERKYWPHAVENEKTFKNEEISIWQEYGKKEIKERKERRKHRKENRRKRRQQRRENRILRKLAKQFKKQGLLPD